MTFRKQPFQIFSLSWIAGLTALTLASCSGRSEEKFQPDEAQKAIQTGRAVLVDVREADEIREGMIQDAIWVPLSRFDQASQKLEKRKEILLYCKTGARAARASESLKKAGYQVRNLGGYQALVRKGFRSLVPRSITPP